jgi:hypothetical protein
MSGENRKGECPRLTSGKPSQYRVVYINRAGK